MLGGTDKIIIDGKAGHGMALFLPLEQLQKRKQGVTDPPSAVADQARPFEGLSSLLQALREFVSANRLESMPRHVKREGHASMLSRSEPIWRRTLLGTCAAPRARRPSRSRGLRRRGQRLMSPTTSP